MFTEINVDINIISKYIFKKLSKEEDIAFSNFLEDHEDFAEITEGLIDYCLDHNIKSIDDLRNQLDKDLSGFPNMTILTLNEPGSQQTKSAEGINPKGRIYRILPYLIAASIIGLIIFWLFTNNQKSENLPIASLEYLVLKFDDKIGYSGDLDWDDDAKNNRHDSAFSKMKQMIELESEQTDEYIFQIFFGAYKLELEKKPQDAIIWLKKAIEKTKDPAVYAFLIKAYNSNKQQDQAQQILDSLTNIGVKIPNSLIDLLELSPEN